MSYAQGVQYGHEHNNRSLFLSTVEIQIALIHDHVANRHAKVGIIECPICAKLNEQAAECQHPIGCEHDLD